MTRTTIALDDDLLRAIKRRAVEESVSMQALVNRLLRQSLAVQTATESYELNLQGWDTELNPGVDLLDRDSLLDALDRQ